LREPLLIFILRNLYKHVLIVDPIIQGGEIVVVDADNKGPYPLVIKTEKDPLAVKIEKDPIADQKEEDQLAEKNKRDQFTDDKERDQLLFSLITTRSDAELKSCETLDGKASSIIGFVGIIIGLVGGIIALMIGALSTNATLANYYYSWRFLLFLGIIFLVLSIIVNLIVFWVRDYSIVPDPKGLIQQYAMDKSKNICTIIELLGKQICKAIKENQSINLEKSGYIKISLVLFSTGMGLIVIFLCGLLIK
jgi:hypothetical protein